MSDARHGGSDRGLALVASLALLMTIWPPSLPGPPEVPLVGEGSDSESGQLSLAASLAERGDRAAMEIAAPGLSPERWRDLGGASIRFTPAALTQQLVHLQWPARLALGEAFEVSGRAALSSPATVVLSDPFAVEEVRAELTPEHATFALSLTPRALGPYLARLSLVGEDGTTLEDGAVPVTVAEPTPLRLMVESSAPSFELSALRRWAEASGAEWSMRVRVAQDRYVSRFVNRDGPLSEREADLLLVDVTAWRALDRERRRDIAEAVSAGLGVLVLGDASLQSTPWADEVLAVPKLSNTFDDEAVLVNHLGQGQALAALSRAGPRLSDDLQVRLLVDDEGSPLAAMRRQGLGRVGWLGVTGTHRWVTAGRGRVHARLWQSVLAAVARPRAPAAIQADALAVRDERTRICSTQGDAGSLRASAGATAEDIALAAGELGRRCGYFWPRETGWHTLRLGEHTQGLYVASSTPWPGVAAQRAQDATRYVAASSALSDRAEFKPLPRAPFLFLFVAVAGLLWWRERTTA